MLPSPSSIPNEKLPLYEPVAAAETTDEPVDRAMPPYKRHLLRRTIPAFIMSMALLAVFRSAFVCHHHYQPGHPRIPWAVEDEPPAKVQLEAFGMSKCPDMAYCLQELIVPTMAQVSDKVNFTLSYIGQVDPNSDAVSCMHGPGECLGNIIQLCAAQVYPDPKMYLGFTNCMTSDYKDIPQRDLVETCALEFGLDFQKLNTCISDEGEGIGLLRSSIRYSQENNITKSCTVRLAGKIRCIRDGGKWYDCPGGSATSDLVRDINDLYQATSTEVKP